MGRNGACTSEERPEARATKSVLRVEILILGLIIKRAAEGVFWQERANRTPMTLCHPRYLTMTYLRELSRTRTLAYPYILKVLSARV